MWVKGVCDGVVLSFVGLTFLAHRCSVEDSIPIIPLPEYPSSTLQTTGHVAPLWVGTLSNFPVHCTLLSNEGGKLSAGKTS